MTIVLPNSSFHSKLFQSHYNVYFNVQYFPKLPPHIHAFKHIVMQIRKVTMKRTITHHFDLAMALHADIIYETRLNKC